jgi:hypothetical protein
MARTCQKSVPIFPTRYSVKIRENEEDELKTDYATLQHSEYTLRTLRKGFVYLYDSSIGENGLKIWEVSDDGKFIEILSTTGALVTKSLKNMMNNSIYKKGDTHNYILASAKSTETYIAYSDTLWNSNIFNKVTGDEDVRKRLMTKIDVLSWDESSPSKDTFHLEELSLLVEEFKDENWIHKFLWSEFRTPPPMKDAKKLENIMRSSPTCENRKAMGVMLYDNIGLVREQTNIISLASDAVEKFASSSEFMHGKLISTCIEEIYKLEICKTQKTNDAEEFIRKEKSDFEFAKKEVREFPAKANDFRITEYETNLFRESLIKMEKYRGATDTPEDFRARVFKKHSKDRMRSVNEEARQKFLKDYKKKEEELILRLLEVKNDRWTLLYHYKEPKVATHLGSSFFNYDTNDSLSASFLAQSFAQCTEGMTYHISEFKGVPNREQALFKTWWDLADENPFLNALEWGYNSKTDTMATAIAAFAELLDKSGNTQYNEDLAKEQHGAKDKKKNIQGEVDVNKSSKSSFELEKNRLSKIIKRELSELHRKYSNQAIMNNISSYSLSKTFIDNKGKKITWKGAVKNNIDSMIQKVLHLPSKEAAIKFRRIVNGIDDTKVGKYFERLTTENISTPELLKQLGASANLGDVEQEMLFNHGKSLKQDSMIMVSLVQNQDIHTRHTNIVSMEAKEQVTQTSIDKIDDKITKATGELDKQEQILKKEPKAFTIQKAMSPLLVVANLINLYNATVVFDWEDEDTFNDINIANFIAAFTGTAAALFYVKESYSTIQTEVVAGKIAVKVRWVTIGVRFFGFLAAVADGLTQFAKAKKAYENNNEEAGATYMVSGVLLGVGGLVLLSSAPIALFLGAVLLIGGMMTLFKAEGLEWDKLDRWLDASLFGKYNIPNNVIYWQEKILNPLYFEKLSQVTKEHNHEKEYQDFIRFFFIPKFEVIWEGTAYLSNIDDRVITVKVRFPSALKKNFYWGWRFTRFKERPQLNKTVEAKGKMLLAPYRSKINEKGEFELKFKEVRYNFKDAVFGVSWQLPFSNGSYTITSYYGIDEDKEEAILLNKEISQ